MFKGKNSFYLLDAVQTAALTPEQKVYFTDRYMDLVRRHRKKYSRVNCLYNTLRITVMVGSIFIPALLTLQKDPTTIISVTTYWVVFGLSLCVTLSNSLLELFNVAALNTKYWLHVHRLETEGWQFLHLSEGYSKFDTVQEAFTKFASKVEKLHLSLVFDLLRLENRKVNNGEVKNNDSLSTNGNGSSISPQRPMGQLSALDFPRPMSDNGSVDMEHRKKPSPLETTLHEFQSRLDDSDSKKDDASY